MEVFVAIWVICGLIGLAMMFSRGALGFFKSLALLFFFGWLIIPFLVALGPISILIAVSKKRCPMCRKSIASGAKICPYCQSAQ